MSQSSKLVINTLEKNFAQCRAFHDLFNDLTREQYDTEFINIVSTPVLQIWITQVPI